VAHFFLCLGGVLVFTTLILHLALIISIPDLNFPHADLDMDAVAE